MVLIEKRLLALEKERKELLVQLDAHRSRKRFLCVCCLKTHAIRDCHAIQEMWYTSASGCSDGDYWNMGGLQIICPTTDLKNRVLWKSYYKVDWSVRQHYAYSAEAQFSRLYKHLFKSIIVSHTGQKDEDKRRYVNTQYFDENRQRFNLHVKGLDK